MSRLSFSIVINTYNRAHTIRNSLESLSYLRHPNYEVIVVNGPSTDNTAEILEEYSDKLKIGYCNEANLSKSRNIGIAMAEGDIVCFMDDDAVPEPDWLGELEAGYISENIAGVGGYIRNHTGVDFQSKVVICDRYADSQEFEDIDESGIANVKDKSRYLTMTGTNSSFRRESLLKIGGFDEEYAYFLDETDVIIRLIDEGFDIECNPNAEIHHKYAESHLRTVSKIPKSIYLPVRSKAYFCVLNATTNHSLDEVYQYLNNYQLNLRRDKKWLVDHKEITQDHYDKLIHEIDQGVKDGIFDAFSQLQRQLLTSKTLSNYKKPFRQFLPILPSKKRLKICFLSQEYPPKSCGGIGVWTYNMAVSLAARGHEVTVICKGEGSPTVDFEEGVWVHRIIAQYQPERTLPDLPDLPQSIKDYAYTCFDEVMRVHARRGLDVVSSPIWDLEGAAVISDNTIPTLLSLHSSYKLVLPSKTEWVENQDFLKNHVEKLIDGEKWALDKANYIVANSKAIVADIEREYSVSIPADKVKHIPHGLKDYNQSCEVKKSSSSLKLLYVGRFEKRKGTDTVLSVIPQLMEKYSNLEIAMVGDHSISNDDEQMLARFKAEHEGKDWLEKVSFPGRVNDEELMMFYKNAHVFVAPSTYESFGLIYLEAMMFGTPCIGTNIGGIPEVISQGKDGFLIEVNNAEELLVSCEKLLGDDELRSEFSKNARKSFSENYTNDVMADVYLDTFSFLISQ